MEDKQEPPNVISSQDTSIRSTNLRKIFFPRSKLSSYNGIVIAVCAATLMWVLLQWDFRQIFKNSDKYTENIYPTVLDERDTSKNIKNSNQPDTEHANTFTQDTIGKLDKTVGIARETLKYAGDLVVEKAKDVVDALRSKTQEIQGDLKEAFQETKDKVEETSQATMDKLKETSQVTVDKMKETSQSTMDKVKETSQSTMDKLKETLLGTHTEMDYRFEMPGLIEQALLSLKEFLNPHLRVEEQIPTKILSGAKAVVFLTVLKGGVGISGAAGTGIVISRNDGEWSGPSAIILAGVDIGLNIGIEKSDHIIILREDSAIRAFGSIGQLRLGLDVSIAAGPKGRDASIGLSVGDKGYSATISYSMAQGAYLGLSLEGQIITIRNDCNEQYYNKPVEASKILDGSIEAPINKNLDEIYEILDAQIKEKEEL